MTQHLSQESPEDIAFVERILQIVPGLRPRYDDIVRRLAASDLEDGGPTVLVSRYTGDLVDDFADPASRAALTTLASALEDEYGRDDDVDSTIEGPFLSHLYGRTAAGDPADVLGPKLRAVIDERRAWRAAPADQALYERMVAAVPALAALDEDNHHGDHGDVLIHGFLADVVRREVEEVEAGRVEEARAVVDLLESLWGGDADEAVAVSFVENLPRPGEPGQALLGMLGPGLRAELDRQRRASGEPDTP